MMGPRLVFRVHRACPERTFWKIQPLQNRAANRGPGRHRGRRTRSRLLHRLADQRRLPLRRVRAGEVVRRRHRVEVGQVRELGPAAACRVRRRPPDRQRQPAASPLPDRRGARPLGPQRLRRDDRAARRSRRETCGRARALRSAAAGGRVLIRAMGRQGLGPGELAGEAVPIAARLAQLAEFVEVAHRLGGVAAATPVATRRAGSQFDLHSRLSSRPVRMRSSTASTRCRPGMR